MAAPLSEPHGTDSHDVWYPLDGPLCSPTSTIRGGGCVFGGASTGRDSPLKEAMDIYIFGMDHGRASE